MRSAKAQFVDVKNIPFIVSKQCLALVLLYLQQILSLHVNNPEEFKLSDLHDHRLTWKFFNFISVLIITSIIPLKV